MCFNNVLRLNLILSILLMALSCSAIAEESPQKLFDFASSLYDSGDYYGAVLEYKRLLNYFPSSALAEESSFMIGMGYYSAEKNEDAAKTFDRFVLDHPLSKKASDALEKMAQSYYKDEKFDNGIIELNDHKAKLKTAKLLDLSEYLIGWGYLGQFKFKESSSVFYYLGTREGEYKEKAKALSGDAKVGETLPSKSPALAGILSAVVPGAGQIYSERYYDGLVSLFLNASFIYLATESNRTENYSAGVFFSIIELGWYTGNIYGGSRSADRYNNERKDELINGLKVKYQFEF